MCKESFETKKQDFLWYSFFGITKTDAYEHKDKALDACIERAYRDLSRTITFLYSANKLDEMKKDSPKQRDDYINLKEAFKKDIKRIITAYIFDNKFSAKRESFDNWHNELCKALIKKTQEENYKDNLFGPDKKGQVTYLQYGQAQKWVNMTLKYMLIMGCWGIINDAKYVLHIPIDDYIYKAAKAKEGKPIHKSMSVLGLGQDWITDDDSNKISWSNINDYNKYKDYQDSIEKKLKETNQNMSPIEWEFDAWIAQAKKENNK